MSVICIQVVNLSLDTRSSRCNIYIYGHLCHFHIYITTYLSIYIVQIQVLQPKDAQDRVCCVLSYTINLVATYKCMQLGYCNIYAKTVNKQAIQGACLRKKKWEYWLKKDIQLQYLLKKELDLF